MLRLKEFDYHRPAGLDQASELATTLEGACLMAGGTDLLVRMKRGLIAPAAVIDLKGIPGLAGISTLEQGGLRLGALTTVAELAGSVLVRRDYPVLAQAASVLGAPAIRTLATVGGNVSRASPASDLVPALMVLGAKVLTRGPAGGREHPAGEVCTGPGATCLLPGELITGLDLSPPRAGSAGAYLKFGRRRGLDLALAGVAVWLRLDRGGDRIEDVRLALSAVGPTPLKARRAEELLAGARPDEDLLIRAGRLAAEESSPISDQRASAGFRRRLVEVLTPRALAQALARARGSGNTEMESPR